MLNKVAIQKIAQLRREKVSANKVALSPVARQEFEELTSRYATIEAEMKDLEEKRLQVRSRIKKFLQPLGRTYLINHHFRFELTQPRTEIYYDKVSLNETIAYMKAKGQHDAARFLESFQKERVTEAHLKVSPTKATSNLVEVMPKTQDLAS